MGLNIARYMSEELIKLELETVTPEYVEGASREKWRQRSKEMVLDELVSILEASGQIGNRSKFLNDFINRERKATTAIGYGLAIPHIRSMQAKNFMLGFARSSRGYDFGAMDEEPTRLFFIMAAPPYDDIRYLRVFKALAETLRYESFREELLSLQTPYEVIRAVESMG
ncbi:MAG: PTS sugar transporter subunit IIA [candidate division Zixibacteria bacterium]|nr:PTS sugar transporter subunit IIA [candidate division Zixibacteria bacterium]